MPNPIIRGTSVIIEPGQLPEEPVEYDDLVGVPDFPQIEEGLNADRPAASAANEGRLWKSTDFLGGLLQIDNGGTWVEAAPGMEHAYRHAVGGDDELSYSALGWIKDADHSTVLAERHSGDELTHNEFTSPVSITATSEATAQNLVASSSFTFNGSTPVLIEGFIPDIVSSSGAWTCNLVLWDDTANASIGLLGQTLLALDVYSGPLCVRRRLTPANGARIYSLRAYRGTNNGSVNAGAGGVGAKVPGFIRIVKA